MRDPDDALISRPRFRRLELIRSLCATGSLHKTARAMSLSQPAISSAFVSQGLVPPRPWIESMAPLSNIELVAAGHGIAAVPSSLVRSAP